MKDFVTALYKANNERSAEAIAELLGARGTYEDPICGTALSGAALTAHLRSFFAAFPEVRLEAYRTIEGADALAVEWNFTGLCDGEIDRDLKGHGVRVTFSGVDVFAFSGDAIASVRRTFDRRRLADALGLQSIVEPHADGTASYGYALRDWISKAKPGALGMTWILARDETEKAVIRGHSKKIVAHFHEVPGFIGIVTGFTGLHGFTFTAWESEEALRRGTREKGAHLEAMQAFLAGLSGGVFTSVWAPAHLNRLWTRCPNGHPNDGTRADRKCEQCGEPLPEREPYL